jgi:elongator complex protein 1
MQDDPALENIDVMTDATQATAFTRYTNAASTVLTRMTGHTQSVPFPPFPPFSPADSRLCLISPLNCRKSTSTAKNKRKNDRKRLGGRKGTVDEEEYLLGSFARLVEKFKAMIGERPPYSPFFSQLSFSSLRLSFSDSTPNLPSLVHQSTPLPS